MVRVNQRQNRFAQQFTVAHEIGHLLLRSLPLERIREISNRDEEALCDDLDLHTHDVVDGFRRKDIEEDDLVEAVEEFGAEEFFQG